MTGVLEFSVHVRNGLNALIFCTVNENLYKFDLTPTINWVPSSSSTHAHKIPMQFEFSNETETTLDLTISVENNDVLICGYEIPGANFVISDQPQWNVPDWCPYDISGHQGENAEYQGNGSLQILAGQSVRFKATVFK